MVSKKERGRTQKSEQETNNDGVAGYEQFRDQRIKENMERMEKLGILELSRKLKTSKSLPPKNPPKKKPALPPSEPTRRSSRLTNRTPVNYSEKRTPKKEGEEEKLFKNLDIHIKEGSKPEIYTEEHENLLGDCKTTWTLYVDGYDEDGHRIYDPFEGKSCHQCRQKTLGLHTDCSNCRLVQGQLCGDCLYMRYGENVTEANKNPGWNCPVCRGICNCSRCRRDKGWEPTGNIYRKVLGLGFRSVAHYLIQTHRVPSGKNPLSANRSLFADREADSSNGIPKPQSDGNKLEMEEENSNRDGGDGVDGNVNYVDDSDDDYEEDGDHSEDADNGEHLSDQI